MGELVPRTVSGGSCDRNDHTLSPVLMLYACSSPPEVLVTTNRASITGFAKTSEPVLLDQSIDLLSISNK